MDIVSIIDIAINFIIPIGFIVTILCFYGGKLLTANFIIALLGGLLIYKMYLFSQDSSVYYLLLFCVFPFVINAYQEYLNRKHQQKEGRES